MYNYACFFNLIFNFSSPQSYMEDHLNNKDRMSKEWEALCSYEADPCTQDAGKAPENANKNRVKTAVPCK